MPTSKSSTVRRRPAAAKPKASPIENLVGTYRGRGVPSDDGRHLLWTTDEPDVVEFVGNHPGAHWYTITGDGQVELRIPVRVKTKMFRAVAGQLDELDAMVAMLDGLGAADLVAAIDELDIFETAALVSSWFAEVNGRIGALSVGEPAGSSS